MAGARSRGRKSSAARRRWRRGSASRSTSFAYPVGDPTSAGAREFALAREAGYEIAVTTRPGMLFPEHAAHLLALPRVSLNGLWQDLGYLDVLLTGAPFRLWNRGRRLNVAVSRPRSIQTISGIIGSTQARPSTI